AGGDDDVLLAVGEREEAVLAQVADVARAEPPVAGEYLACRLGILVVAGEDRRRADEHLAVVCEPQLDVRHRQADGAEAEARRPVDRGGRRALRLAPAFDDEDVERVEELADLLRERGAAGDADAEAAAELALHLRVHEPVGEPVLEREPAAQALAALARRARAAADLERPVDEPAAHPAQ